MEDNKPIVISVGYGRHMFEKNNLEYKRMMRCVRELSGLHMIIFTLRGDNLSTQSSEYGLTLHPTNSVSKFTMIFDAYRIGKEIINESKVRPIVTTQDPFEAGLVGLFLKNKFDVHLTVQEHADAFSLPFWRKETIGNSVRYIVGKYVLRQADTVRVVGERIYHTLKKFNLKANITKLPVAVNIDDFIQTECDESPRAFKEDTFQFLTVARFVPQKNLSLMIEAFASVYQKNQQARLLIVGKGPEKAKLEKMVAKHFSGVDKPVVLTEWSDNIPCLMKQSDAYLLTSNYEGWARVLIEATLCGLPIVTTDVGCAGEAVQNGVHGLVVPVADKEALEKAMDNLINNLDLYRKMKQNLFDLKLSDIAGTDFEQYGINWVRSLT